MQIRTATSFQLHLPCKSGFRVQLAGTVPAPLLASRRHQCRQSHLRQPTPIQASSDLPISWEPTGVPLVDDLAAFKTIQESGIHAVKLVAVALIGVFVGSLLLKAIASKSEEDGPVTGFNPVNIVIGAISAPASALLPLYGYIYSATVVSSLVQVAAGKAKYQFNQLCLGHGDKVLQIVKWLTQMVQDASEIVFIVAVAWTVVRIKDRVVLLLGQKFFSGKEGLARLTNSVSFLTNYVIYGSAVLASLITCGFNITPLLASVGASSVILGLATQNILVDVASGFTLFASPPFAPGDQVKFLNDGAMILEGTVLEIEPLRTVLKTPEGSTLYISNSKVTGWEIQNDTRTIA